MWIVAIQNYLRGSFTSYSFCYFDHPVEDLVRFHFPYRVHLKMVASFYNASTLAFPLIPWPFHLSLEDRVSNFYSQSIRTYLIYAPGVFILKVRGVVSSTIFRRNASSVGVAVV